MASRQAFEATDRTIAMRMIIVAGLLMVALLGAVLSSVGAGRRAWVSAPDEVYSPPEREISDRITPGVNRLGNRG